MSGYNSEWEELVKSENKKKRADAKKAKANNSLVEEFELMSKQSLFELYTLARKKNEMLESIVESQKNLIDLFVFSTLKENRRKVKAPKMAEENN